jgi:glycosyltransferase involved in cell wall biosynthesis
MDKKRKRILAISEASYTHSGFGNYYNEVLKRLVAMDKYDIAEFASYGYANDPRDAESKWKIYANAVRDNDPRIGQYNSDPFNQWGKWRFERCCLDFKPDFTCTPPGELVLTVDGYKPIEKIQIGDLVPTHTGKLQKVIKLFKRPYEGKLYKIFWHGCKTPITITGNHPVLIYRWKNQTNQKKSYQQIYKDIEPIFVPASEINENDLIVLCPPKIVDNPIEQIDITNYLDNYSERNGKIYPYHRYDGNSINRYIKIDKNFGKLIGYFIGDGCASCGNISFVFHNKEQNFIKDVQGLLLKIFGINSHVYKHSKQQSSSVEVKSIILYKFLKKYCDKFKIPENILRYSSETISGIIYGLIRSDGYYCKNKVVFTSVNKEIVYIYRILCSMLNIPTCLQKVDKLSSYNKDQIDKPYSFFNINGNGLYGDTLHKIAKKHKDFIRSYKKSIRLSVQIINNNLTSKIKQIEIINYHGDVYNIEVDIDNSYILNQSCVHNCNTRDPWMMEWEVESPFRSLYHSCWMPTHDSSPARPQWVDNYIQCDAVFTYSDWAKEMLEEEGGGKIKLQCAAPPGIEIDIFKLPQDKAKQKLSMGLSPTMNIIGSVMRNQKRKLFPDLFSAFNLFLAKCRETGKTELANNTYLYIHTSYPDAGWNLPEIILEHNMGQRLICSYVCQACQRWFAGPFTDVYGVCPHCAGTAILPNVTNGVTRETLANVMQCFDFYVQPTIASGREMPVWEAAACGVPVACMVHSALFDAIKYINAFPIKIAKKYLECETSAYRVMVDTEDMAKVMYEFFQLPFYKRQQLSYKIRDTIVKNFTWDNTAKIWADYFDNAPLTGLQGKWDSPPRLYNIPQSIPPNLSVEEFVTWIFNDVIHQPEKRNSFLAYKLCADLTFGIIHEGGNIRQLNRDMIFNIYRQKLINQNEWEKIRCGMIKLAPEDWLQQATLQEEALKLKTGDIIRESSIYRSV